jgi:hypothetical protein
VLVKEGTWRKSTAATTLEDDDDDDDVYCMGRGVTGIFKTRKDE